MNTIRKYPRTQHITGSTLFGDDFDLSQVSFDKIAGRIVIVEEKVDGSNSGVSFSPDWKLLLQSRGHYLSGGPRERHFNVLKQWAAHHSEAFLEVLTDRYIMYGEWMYAKHTEFYDILPNYFMEFDVLDTQEGTYIDGEGKEHKGSWLSTQRRKELLQPIPIEPIRVLFEGELDNIDQLLSCIGPSAFKSDDNVSNLREQAERNNADPDNAVSESDTTNLMEGLYIKVEEDGVVKERYKWVRNDFIEQIHSSNSHWLARPLIPNMLAEGVDIYA